MLISKNWARVGGLIVGVTAEGKTDYLDNIVLCEGHLNVWLSNNNHLIKGDADIYQDCEDSL